MVRERASIVGFLLIDAVLSCLAVTVQAHFGIALRRPKKKRFQSSALVIVASDGFTVQNDPVKASRATKLAGGGAGLRWFCP